MIRCSLLLLLAAVSFGSAAVTTAPRKGPEGNRFLFVVDTSSSMKRVEHSGRQVVFDFVYSGIEQRMQPGDTFGVWTFGNEVKAGVFPVQTWTPEKSTDLASQVSRFVKEQGSGRGSRLDIAIADIERLIKSVRDLDVVLVTSASTRFKPDDTWAMLLQNWNGRLEEAKKSNKAIIVTLAGRGGQIRQATIALQGERLNLAAPPDRRPAPMAKAAPAPEPPKPTREPIIMRGSPKARPIDEVPTQFSPPPQAEPPVVEPAVNPLPEPSPVPVVGLEKPIVAAPPVVAPTAAPAPAPAPKPQPELTVTARAPGVLQQATPTTQAPAVSRRMLVIAGASLMLIAGLIGIWALAQARARNRVSYISQSIANKSD